MTTVDPLGRSGRLITKYRGMEQVEASWLEELGGFDADEEWRLFGHGSCPEWLMTFLDLNRATAFEKVRVARMLRRRPILTASYREGRVSYSKVRAITRLEEIDTEMEQVFTALAEEAGLTEVEHAVRAYQLHHEQEMPPRFRNYRRGCRIRPVGDGLCQVTAILTELEAAELERLLDEVIQKDAPPAGAESPAVDWVSAESPAVDSLPAESPAVDDFRDETPVETGAGGSPAGDWWDSWVITSQEYAERRADALMDVLGQARDYLYADRSAVDVADRYLVHVIVDPDGHASLPDGAPLSASEAAVAMCGAPLVSHEVGEDGNPLYQGRKTREWTTAQRRAALVRDGHCRFPGCWRRRADLHHQWFWATGGPTDIDNGLLLCRFHHHVVHKEAYQITGNPGGVLTFTRSGGRRIGYTQPVRRALVSRELISR